MQLKDILKLVGAGLTGGLLALKIRRPRQAYDEFVRIYSSLSIEFKHQFETVFLQTMLPAIAEENRDSLCQLLDRHATFQEQLRFFQAHVPTFDDLLIKAFDRLYRLRAEGSIAPTTRRRILPDVEAFQLAVEEVFFDLEKSFFDALKVHVPEEDGELDPTRYFPDLLRELRVKVPSLAAPFFDGLVRFEDTLSNPALR